MPLTLVFLHGWGFGADVWRDVLPRLDAFDCVVADRGYFGECVEPPLPDAFAMVTHSLGAMLALRQPLPGCRTLVAINGFDRFAAGPGSPGVAKRVLDRMVARLEADVRATVADFRARCGEIAPFEEPDKARLARDLAFLRDGDCRADAAAAPFPILSLQGEADPILPRALRDAAFAGARNRRMEVHDDAGHLLPLTHADWCAERIAAFVDAPA
ncbi:MAG: alpha/beta fold hydrolase [Novosphingobium sp.]|nr:alpha/beta fold hydrolase [Novosphingobium sp.]